MGAAAVPSRSLYRGGTEVIAMEEVNECNLGTGREWRQLPDRLWINIGARSEQPNGSALTLRGTVWTPYRVDVKVFLGEKWKGNQARVRPESQWLSGERPLMRVCREWDALRDLCPPVPLSAES